MRRRPEALAETVFDVVVVGGGIVGASAAWEASRRGLQTALVEREDFGSATSANSLKILHGGLRHVQRLELGRARRSLAALNRWLELAPHLVEPVAFLLPVDGSGLHRPWLLRTGLALYDLLVRDRHRRPDLERAVPGERVLDPGECRELAGGPLPEGTVAGVLFHDGLTYDSERLVLELVLAADRAGAVVLNYAEFAGRGNVRGSAGAIAVRDCLSGETYQVETRAVLNAAGPWSASVAVRAAEATGFGLPDAHCVAVNLVTDRPAAKVGMGVDVPPEYGASTHGSRRLFVVPWRGQTLVGTSYHPEDTAREERIEALVGDLNRAWPAFELSTDEVLHVHEGRLPLRSGADDPYRGLMGEGWVHEHERTGSPHLVSAGTVKYTTGLQVAKSAVDAVARRLDERPAEAPPGGDVLPGTPPSIMGALLDEASARASPEIPDEVVRHLVRAYGRRYADVLGYVERHPGGSTRVVPQTPVTVGELAHAAAVEMAACPEDLLFRRTEIGARGWSDASAERTAEKVLADARDGRARSEAEPEI